jgi:acetaldehyde/propanal dehydrogenase
VRVKAAIIGPGNIGTDLLYKALRSEVIEPVWAIGVVEGSEGLKRAAAAGLKTTHLGLDAVLEEVIADGIRIVFDATSAKHHPAHSAALTPHGVKMIDLTPASIGPGCVPPVNLKDLPDDIDNVSLVTCGGQATIPMVAAVSRVQPVAYGEIIATVASLSVGPGTRHNIDEFTRATSAGVRDIGGAKRGKAIIIINPAEPAIMMRDTIHCLTEDEPDQEAITASVHDMVAEVQRYVPGYTLKNGPVFDGKRVTVWMEVRGLGDFLPEFAGNLDIMTAAALRTAELLALRMGGAA